MTAGQREVAACLWGVHGTLAIVAAIDGVMVIAISCAACTVVLGFLLAPFSRKRAESICNSRLSAASLDT